MSEPVPSAARLAGNVRIGTKILMVVLLVAALGGAVGLFALRQMSSLADASEGEYGQTLKAQAVADLRSAFNRTRINALEYLLAGDDATRATERKEFDTEVANVVDLTGAYRSLAGAGPQTAGLD
ncbi:MCP four helix bundle domain-containing protein, partial [Actinoplanes philippinensis]|uniref:MCP four helix bundle domain-containing protein n=1 Tax=Actinoplanes philippinensis TaxID=35752 RepID=UPI0033CE5A40